MADVGSEQKLKVFISYSRRDSSEFAEELVIGLELAGFAPFLDRHDIAAGEDWEIRLGGLINEADTVVFVVSPESVKSPRCAWEVDKALAEAKRVLPIIFKLVAEDDIAEQLRRRQFVRFDTAQGMIRPLAQLAEALRQDLAWLREHTRIGELAQRWDARGRRESLLLRSDDLAAAQTWAGNWKPGAPAITDLMQTFIVASKDAEAAYLAKSNAAQRRTIRMQAVMSVLLVGVIVGLVGWINQTFIKEQWRWYATVKPFVAANIRPYVLTAAAEHALKPLDSFKECSREHGKDYCPEMVLIPAGSVTMGSPLSEKGRSYYEGPQHIVTMSRPFAVSKYELTFAEWDTCAAYGSCPANVTDAGWGRGRQPAIYVTWEYAQQYVSWLSQMTGQPYRLLTEAEYEYAERAGTKTAYPWGDEVGRNNANCNGCGSQWDFRQTSPIGSFAPNAFGLYDMAGNVYQWVEDCWNSNYAGAPIDGSAWTVGECNRHVVRGGSWINAPTEIRSASRNRGTYDGRNNDVGFRVGRTIGE